MIDAYRWAPYAFPEWRWEPPTVPAVRDGRGPERVDVATPDATFKPRAAGFTAKLDDEREPQTWEGDSA